MNSTVVKSLKLAILDAENRVGAKDMDARRRLNAMIVRGLDAVPVAAEACVMPRGKGCDGSSNDTGVRGHVTFVQVSPSMCEITYHITGLTPGYHAMHIHETSDFSNGCASAGPHFNPFNSPHGGQRDGADSRHVGDLGNVLANQDGIASGTIMDPLVKIHGPTSVLHRSVMIHQDEDDLGRGGNDESKITGNAGARVACGAILMRL